MIRFSALVFSVANGLLWSNSVLPQVHAHANSFHRDVIAGVARKERRQLERKYSMQDELLEKAIPISELKSLGVLVEPPSSSSAASEEGANGESRRLEEEVDDYYLNEQYMYSLSGYSLKYSKCQPIKQFSESALEAGQYSPLVTQDVVILRLCPYKSCTSSRQYGCHYNYAEYAIGLFDYIRIMLRYKAEKKASLCEWCTNCLNRRRRLDDAAQADDAAADDYYKYDGVDDDFYQKNDDGGYDQSDECYTSGTYCKNYSSDCQADDDQNNQQSQNYYEDDYSYNRAQKYIAEDEYFDYLGCTELQDSYGGIYFVRPTCDPSADQIKFSVYYDAFCSQSASSLISMDNFQVTFNEAVFNELNEGSCIDCSESNYPPGFTANSKMCNMIHNKGADCTSNMIYDLFDGQQSDSTECSFIESIRFGTYDSNGEIATEASEDAEEVVTDLQKAGLVLSTFLCAGFVLYACYLHHSMTNLLIKSLSHRELLPPSRHSKRRSPGKPKRRRSSKGSKSSRADYDEDDDDWDRNKNLRSPV